MENEDAGARRFRRWKREEELEKSAKKTLRRAARFYTFILGFGYGIFMDITTTGNSILGIIVLPFMIGGVFALLVTALMFTIGL